MSATGKYWLWSFFTAVVFIAVNGYQFNCSDQEEHLPQVYKLLDNSLYKGDYVVENLLSDFSIRFFYVRVVYLLSLVLPVSTVCFLLYLLLATVSVYFASRLAGLLLKNDGAGIFSASVAFILLNNFTVGGNNIQDTILTCTVFANAGCFAAWYYFFKKNYVTAFAFAGAASLFQVLMGLHVFVLMFLMLLIIEKGRRVVKLFYVVAIYLLFSSPMLIPILYRQFFLESNVQADLFYYTLYVFRNPHHYIPSYFPVKDFVKTGLLLIGAIASVYILKPVWKKEFYALAGLIIVGMFLYYLLLEKINLPVAGKLQWFKTCVWLSVFCCIALGLWMSQMPVFNKLFLSNKFHYVLFFFSLSTLLLLLNTKYLPLKHRQYNYQLGNYCKSDLTLMHEWINANTEKDALFITLPFDDSFLCEAKRPLLIAYKAVIHEPWFMAQWYIDFLNAYKINDEIEWKHKDVLRQANESYTNYNNSNYLKQKQVKYRIDDVEQIKYQNQLGKVMFKSGNYVLTSL